MIEFALVDLGFMGGVSLHGETFKKEKWYVVSCKEHLREWASLHVILLHGTNCI